MNEDVATGGLSVSQTRLRMNKYINFEHIKVLNKLMNFSTIM
jgi:hypothetical protein